MSIEPLKHDPTGVAAYIDREAEALPAYHWSRELLQNALDAGATRIVFDAYTNVASRRLARCSDNGHGMADHELREHGRTLHLSGPHRDDNYGVGGRLATLTANPSGVVWASLAAGDAGAMIRLRRERDRYGIYKFEFDDGSRDLVAAPDDGMLDQIGDTGTAVILEGDGHSHTWDTGASHGVATFLSRRYFRVPADVVIDHGTGTNRLVPFGDSLDRNAEASGTIAVDDDGSVAHWFILRKPEDRLRAQSYPIAAIGARVDDELFDMVLCTDRRARYGQFGIIGKTARSRVAIVVVPAFDVRMTTSRAGVVRAGGETLPWEAWGERFVDELPDEIRALTEATVSDAELDERWLAELDAEWHKLITAIPTRVYANDGDLPFEVEVSQLTTGEPEGAQEETSERERAGTVTPPRPRAVGTDGAERGRDRKTFRIPDVKWLTDDEWDEDQMLFAYYNRVTNQVLLRREALEFDAVAGRYASEFPALAGEPLRAMVLKAYGTEAVAKVMHALAKERNAGWLPEWIEHALSAEGLSAALLGMNAIDRTIRDRCRAVMTGR